jgi:hypothetical protein
MRRRKSGAIHGADDDACELSAHLVDWLAGRGRPTPYRGSTFAAAKALL